MASGTLVPFMNVLGLPGDTFDIDLDIDIQTLPTLGPLFGKYKIQLDVFMCPIRNYIGQLHMNMLDIGNKMQTVKIPQVRIEGYGNAYKINGDNDQISPSSVMAYFGIRGLGVSKSEEVVKRDFNGLWWLQYLDTYKQYYANKQEEVGYIVHNELNKIVNKVISVKYFDKDGNSQILDDNVGSPVNHYDGDKGYFIVEMEEDDPWNVPSIHLVYELSNLMSMSVLQVFDKYLYMGNGVWNILVS